jgi:hypothetical protein
MWLKRNRKNSAADEEEQQFGTKQSLFVTAAQTGRCSCSYRKDGITCDDQTGTVISIVDQTSNWITGTG